MATGAPATPHAHVCGVGRFSDENLAGGHSRPLHLGVTPQTEIIVALEEKLGID